MCDTARQGAYALLLCLLVLLFVLLALGAHSPCNTDPLGLFVPGGATIWIFRKALTQLSAMSAFTLPRSSGQRLPHGTVLPQIFKYLREHTDLYEIETQHTQEQSLLEAFRALRTHEVPEPETEPEGSAVAPTAEPDQPETVPLADTSQSEQTTEQPEHQQEVAEPSTEQTRTLQSEQAELTSTAVEARETEQQQPAIVSAKQESYGTARPQATAAVPAESAAELSEDLLEQLKNLKLRRKLRYLVMKIHEGCVIEDCSAPPSAGVAELRAALPYSDCRYNPTLSHIINTSFIRSPY